MENNQILPQGWIEDILENYLYQHKTKSHYIYIVVVLAVAAALVSLPFINVDISVAGMGVIRPQAERSVIVAPISEIVDEVFVTEGDHLVKGQPILRFRTSSADTRIGLQENVLLDINQQYADLTYLARGGRPPVFQSSARQQEYLSFLSKKEQIQTDINQYKAEWLRNKALFDKHLISEEEYNRYLYQYQDKENELKSLVQNQMSVWQTDRNNLNNQRNEATSNIKSNQVDKELFTVCSPVTGTIEQFNGIYRGLNLQAGTQLAFVSPDSTLYLEAYVAPKDIAFIQEGMPVKVQLESFNYNEWGQLEGIVTQISSDFITDENNGYLYKVKVKLTKDFLTLKSTGRIGRVKKGMTALAHFVVTKRSLFDILYHNIDHWVNPTQNKLNKQ